MDVERYEDGVPSWVDLGTPDMAGASEFYGGLFGWDVQVGPPEAGGYALAYLRGRTVAGLGPQQNPGPPFWTTYVNVADAEAVAARAQAHRGQVLVAPMDVMEQGRMAVLADPAGAIISVWQAKGHPGAGVVNEPGAYSWSELVTVDTDGAAAFYPAVFGWTVQRHGGGDGAYDEWQVAGRSVAGMMPKPPEMPADIPPHWAVYFAVTDADEAVERVRELGGSVLLEPIDIEPGRVAAVMDPSGAAFNVMAMNP